MNNDEILGTHRIIRSFDDFSKFYQDAFNTFCKALKDEIKLANKMGNDIPSL